MDGTPGPDVAVVFCTIPVQPHRAESGSLCACYICGEAVTHEMMVAAGLAKLIKRGQERQRMGFAASRSSSGGKLLACLNGQACGIDKPANTKTQTDGGRTTVTEFAAGTTELSDEQKRAFYRDGYLVLRKVVPSELTRAAKRRINIIAGRGSHIFKYYDELASSPEFPNLMNQSALGAILRNTMGPFDPPTRAMPMVLPPVETPPEGEALPNFGFAPHIDGQWSGKVPAKPEDVDNWSAPRTPEFGAGDATERGSNNTPLFQDPECRLSLGSFTAFVGVALNDQTGFGRGNLAILAGAHHAVEAFFRWQRDAGGPVGPEGPGWPRLMPVGNNSVGINLMPEVVRDQFKEGAEYTADGRLWLKPTPILLDEGDAVITLHAIPHCGTRNELGVEPRQTVYFRIRRERQGAAVVSGDSDHPDRGWMGEFLDYAEGVNPWEVAIEAMCDHWSEWDGMQEIVAEASKSRAES